MTTQEIAYAGEYIVSVSSDEAHLGDYAVIAAFSVGFILIFFELKKLVQTFSETNPITTRVEKSSITKRSDLKIYLNQLRENIAKPETLKIKNYSDCMINDASKLQLKICGRGSGEEITSGNKVLRNVELKSTERNHEITLKKSVPKRMLYTVCAPRNRKKSFMMYTKLAIKMEGKISLHKLCFGQIYKKYPMQDELSKLQETTNNYLQYSCLSNEPLMDLVRYNKQDELSKLQETTNNFLQYGNEPILDVVQDNKQDNNQDEPSKQQETTNNFLQYACLCNEPILDVVCMNQLLEGRYLPTRYFKMTLHPIYEDSEEETNS